MDRKRLVKNLSIGTYCRLKPSTISGVGVFAIRDIDPGIYPFRLPNNDCERKSSIKISSNELNGLPPQVIQMLKEMYSKDGNTYYIPKTGTSIVNISNYLNLLNN